MNHPPFLLKQDEWYVLVGNKQFGPWPDKGSALAGYQTELIRAAQRSKARFRAVPTGSNVNG